MWHKGHLRTVGVEKPKTLTELRGFAGGGSCRVFLGLVLVGLFGLGWVLLVFCFLVFF